MTSVEAIRKILNEQVDSFRLLLDLLQRERACIRDLRPECVEEIAKEKNTLVLRLKLLEEERLTLVEKFLPESSLGGSAEELSLEKLYELTGDSDLRDIKAKLLSLLRSVDELNTFNRMLIERSLHCVRGAESLFDFVNRHPEGKSSFFSRETL